MQSRQPRTRGPAGARRSAQGRPGSRAGGRRLFGTEKNLPKAVDLAYVAARTAQIAEAHAETALTERKMATQAAGTLTAARAQLAKAERGEAQQAQQVGLERTAREAAEQKADASEQKAGVSEEKRAASEQRAQQANDALDRLS